MTLGFLALLPTALAQQEVCERSLDRTDFRAVVDEADAHLQEGEIPDALARLEAFKKITHCMDTLVAIDDLAAYARVHAVASYFNQEENEALRWGRLVEHLIPGGRGWGEWPEDHPARELVREADEPELFETDQGFVLEKNGAVFVDGKFAQRPQAMGDMPHLVQVFNGKGHLLRGAWQDGDAFPPDLVGPPVKLSVPAYFDPMTSTITPKGKPPSDLPPRQPLDPLVVTGVGLVGVSAVLYSLAGVSHSRFRCNPSEREGCPSTPEELTKLRSRTNLLAITAGVSFLGGVGLGVTGVLTDGSPGLQLQGRW